MKITDLFKKHGIELENATVYDVKKILAATNPKPKDNPINDNNIDTETLRELLYKVSSLEAKLDAKDKEIADLKTSITEKDNVIKGFETEKVDREKALKSFEEKEAQRIKEEKVKSIETLINSAIEGKKIAPQNEDFINKIKKIADLDIESANAMIENLPSLDKPSGTSNPSNTYMNNQQSAEMTTLLSGVSPAILDRTINQNKG